MLDRRVEYYYNYIIIFISLFIARAKSFFHPKDCKPIIGEAPIRKEISYD